IDGQDGSVAAHPRRCSGLDENTAANIGDKTGPRRRARDNSACDCPECITPRRAPDGWYQYK
ncbi:MAG: hypothetical protein VW016_11285, partial [Luminiphilus sp.]